MFALLVFRTLTCRNFFGSARYHLHRRQPRRQPSRSSSSCGSSPAYLFNDSEWPNLAFVLPPSRWNGHPTFPTILSGVQWRKMGVGMLEAMMEEYLEVTTEEYLEAKMEELSAGSGIENERWRRQESVEGMWTFWTLHIMLTRQVFSFECWSFKATYPTWQTVLSLKRTNHTYAIHPPHHAHRRNLP